MLSVVIPTMWKYAPFCEFLPQVLDSPAVGQVILINNNKAETPHISCLHHSKIQIVAPEKNLYVNPSWNLGVELSHYNKICILSDDVFVDVKLFIKADEFVNESVGVLGACPGNVKEFQPAVTTGTIDIIEWPSKPHVSNWGFGSCFFMMKDHWYKIPDILKIWYGDTMQWEIQIRRGRKNYLATNLVYNSPQSVTIKTLDEIINPDSVEDKFYKRYMETIS